MEEIWKPLLNWPGYEVSNLGRVRSFKKRSGSCGEWTIAERPQRVLKPSLSRGNGGYRQVRLSRDGRVRTCRVSSLVLRAFVGPRPDGMEVCHNDCNPVNDRLDNLRYDTRTGNRRDGVGEHTVRRLTNKQAGEMKQLATQGFSDGELAQKFDVSKSTVQRCRLGYQYPHTKGPLTNRIRQLSNQEVRQLRKQGEHGDIGIAELAEKYGITKSHVSRILRGLRCQKAGGPIAPARYKGAKSAA